jgi:hypothetical protein
MKKNILTISVLFVSSFAFANKFNVIISKEDSNYNSDLYVETGNISCNSVSPLENEVYKNISFTQNHSNCQKELKSAGGNTKWLDIPDFTTNETGSLLLSSCKEILDNGHSTGSKDYPAIIDGAERDLTCNMDTDGGGWTLTYQRHFIDVENGPTRSDMLPTVKLFSDTNSTSTLIDLENRWFVMNGLTNEEFDWMWQSGRGHEYRNIASDVVTSIGKTYAGSEVVWQHWTTEIYQLNQNSGTWDSNTIFDLGYDANHGPAFWDNANGVYKRLDGYQSPENVTLSIYVR